MACRTRPPIQRAQKQESHQVTTATTATSSSTASREADHLQKDNTNNVQDNQYDQYINKIHLDNVYHFHFYVYLDFDFDFDFDFNANFDLFPSPFAVTNSNHAELVAIISLGFLTPICLNPFNYLQGNATFYGLYDVEAETRDVETSAVSLFQRDFTSLTAKGTVAQLQGAASNTDLSDVGTSGLLDGAVLFSDNTAKSMTITQLNGCTGVYIVSPRGMYGAHILEFSGFDINNDLSHEGFTTHLQTVAASLKTKAESILGAGSQLHVLLPTESDGSIVYDVPQPSKAVLEAKMVELNTQSASKATDALPASQKTTKQISAAITSAMEQATTLKATTHKYTIAQILTASIKSSDRGTFVAQFDPQNDDGSGSKGPAVQLSVNGKPVVNRIALA